MAAARLVGAGRLGVFMEVGRVGCRVALTDGAGRNWTLQLALCTCRHR